MGHIFDPERLHGIARSPIITCLPYGLSEAIISAQDVPTVARTAWAFGRGVVRELLQGKI